MDLRPELIRRMVLVSACDGFPPEARAFMRAHAEQAQVASAEGGDPAYGARLTTAQAFARGEDDASISPAELTTIRAPTLLVSGDRDPLYPLEVSLRLARALPSAQLWVVPGEGHLPVFGAMRSEFVARVHAFLEDEASAR